MSGACWEAGGGGRGGGSCHSGTQKHWLAGTRAQRSTGPSADFRGSPGHRIPMEKVNRGTEDRLWGRRQGQDKLRHEGRRASELSGGGGGGNLKLIRQI